MKTLKGWKHSNKEWNEYFKIGDQVDEATMLHILEWSGSAYSNNELGLYQGGDPENTIDNDVFDKIYIYSTFREVDGKIYYLGHLPEFKTHSDEYWERRIKGESNRVRWDDIDSY